MHFTCNYGNFDVLKNFLSTNLVMKKENNINFFSLLCKQKTADQLTASKFVVFFHSCGSRIISVQNLHVVLIVLINATPEKREKQ